MTTSRDSSPISPEFEPLITKSTNLSFLKDNKNLKNEDLIESNSTDSRGVGKWNSNNNNTASNSSRSAPYPNMRGLNVNNTFICGHCGLSLPRASFTEQQLNKRKKFDDNSLAIFCKTCSPKQQLTLECSECDEILPASKFAKNQVSKAEGARCLSCQNKINKRNSKQRKQGGYSDDEDDDEDEDSD